MATEKEKFEAHIQTLCEKHAHEFFTNIDYVPSQSVRELLVGQLKLAFYQGMNIGGRLTPEK